jgi:hypothetical protein
MRPFSQASLGPKFTGQVRRISHEWGKQHAYLNTKSLRYAIYVVNSNVPSLTLDMCDKSPMQSTFVG